MTVLTSGEWANRLVEELEAVLGTMVVRDPVHEHTLAEALRYHLEAVRHLVTWFETTERLVAWRGDPAVAAHVESCADLACRGCAPIDVQR